MYRKGSKIGARWCSLVLGESFVRAPIFEAVFFVLKIATPCFYGVFALVFSLIRYYTIINENRCSECSVEVRTTSTGIS